MKVDWYSIFARWEGNWHKVAEVRSRGLAEVAREAFVKIYGKDNIKVAVGKSAPIPTEGTPCQL